MGVAVGTGMGVAVGTGVSVGAGVAVGAGVGVAVGSGRGVGVSRGTRVGVGSVVRGTPEAHADRTNNNVINAKIALASFIYKTPNNTKSQHLEKTA